MRNIALVARHAIQTTLKKRSFWIMTFILPAFLLAFQVYAALQDNGAGGNRADSTTEEQDQGLAGLPAIGLVDEAGVIARLPAGFPPDLFVHFTDPEAAGTALKTGQIEQIIVIPADYLTSGQVSILDRDFQLALTGENTGLAFGGTNDWILAYLINYNLTGDELLPVVLRNPTPGEFIAHHPLNPPAEGEAADRALAAIIGSTMPYIYYFILLVGSSYLLQSVTAEKENRTSEVLLVSLQPQELMAGKVLGLGVVSLIQLLVWFGGGFFLLQRSATWLSVSALTFPPGFFIWAALYLVLGYLVFGGVMAAGGAIAPTAREGNQLTWILVMPLLPTLMFASEFAENPHGVLPLVLSLFPFSAPTAMVTRMAVAEVPAWQVIVSLAALAATAYLVIRLAGRFFSPDNLLSGAAFSWRRMLGGLSPHKK